MPGRAPARRASRTPSCSPPGPGSGCFRHWGDGGSPARSGLFELGVPVEDPWAAVAGPDDVAVRTRVKADRFCASVAAASVLAKCERDSLMVAFAQDHPAYGWAENKG